MRTFEERVERQYHYKRPGRRLAHAAGSAGLLDVVILSSIDPDNTEEGPSLYVMTGRDHHFVAGHIFMPYSEDIHWEPRLLRLGDGDGDIEVNVPFGNDEQGNRLPITVNDQLLVPAETPLVPTVPIPPTEQALVELLLRNGMYAPAGAPV